MKYNPDLSYLSGRGEDLTKPIPRIYVVDDSEDLEYVQSKERAADAGTDRRVPKDKGAKKSARC